MTTLLGLTLAVLVLVIASLVSGVISMAYGGKYDQRHATHFMFARIGFQGLAILLLLQLAYLHYV